MASKTTYKYFLVTTPSPFVAHVEINRPEKMNAFFEAMWLEFKTVIDALSIDPDVRAVIISGAGDRAFTAGLDVQAANIQGISQSSDVARKTAGNRRHIQEFQDCISSVEKCEKRKCSQTPPPHLSTEPPSLLAAGKDNCKKLTVQII